MRFFIKITYSIRKIKCRTTISRFWALSPSFCRFFPCGIFQRNIRAIYSRPCASVYFLFFIFWWRFLGLQQLTELASQVSWRTRVFTSHVLSTSRHAFIHTKVVCSSGRITESEPSGFVRTSSIPTRKLQPVFWLVRRVPEHTPPRFCSQRWADVYLNFEIRSGSLVLYTHDLTYLNSGLDNISSSIWRENIMTSPHARRTLIVIDRQLLVFFAIIFGNSTTSVHIPLRWSKSFNIWIIVFDNFISNHILHKSCSLHH